MFSSFSNKTSSNQFPLIRVSDSLEKPYHEESICTKKPASHMSEMQEAGGADDSVGVDTSQVESSDAKADDGGIDFGDDDDNDEVDEEHVKRSVKRLRDESDDERVGGGSDLEDSDEGSKDEDVEDDSSGNGSVVFSDEEEEEGDDTENNKKSKNKSKTNKKEKREKKKSRDDDGKKSKKKSKRDFRSLLDIGPDSDDDDDDDDEIVEEEDEFEAGDEEDYIAARAAADEAVKLRHERTSEMMNRSVHDIAAEFERKAQADLIRKQLSQGELGIAGEGVYGKTKSNPVLQQALLPTNNDKIFRVKVASGKEMQLCRSILLKCQEYKRRGIPSGVKSVFATSTKGYIYIEALAEPYAKEIIQKLNGIFFNKFAKVSVPEMQTLLNVQVTKRPLKVGQFVRIKRGVLKGDLVQICELFEGGTKAMIKAVPRPDYTKKSDSNTASGKSARPPQRLFNAEEAQGSDDYRRSRHPRDRSGPWYDFWNGEYYKDGFLHKEVSCSTYITADNIEPRLDELQLFMSHEEQKKQDRVQKKRERKERLESRDDDEDSEIMSDDDFDEGSDTDGAETGNKGQSVLKELVKQLQDSSNDDGKAVPFIVGDMIQVNGGELNNLVGRITSINEISRICEILPMNSVLTNKLSVETSLLVKYITPGYHVKINNGPYMGQTGRVVSVIKENGEHIAAILTDGINSEIKVNVSILQVSDEVNTGNDSLNGYELYDLVILNENESAVVINVGKEKLRIINHMDIVKEVLPLELQGKRNNISSKSKAFDSQQSELSVGDSINVTGGPHLGKKSCTIKHIMKGVLWLHLASYLKNSGVFVVRARNCTIAGTTAGSSRTTASVGSFKPSVGPGRGKDPAIGKSCTITAGQYKGFIGKISAATKDMYTLSISAKLKVVTLPRSIIRLQSDTNNNMMGGNRADHTYYDPTATPAFIAETPLYLGAQTPMNLGSETPLNFDGSMTPSQFGSRTPSQYRRDDDDIWMPNARDDAYDNNYNDNIIVVTYKDWVEKMVVVVNQGKNMGKYAVIQGRPTAEGMFKVMLRDERGKVYGGVIEIHYSDMTPVDKIPKYENVVVIKGNYKGLTAMFEEYHGNDALLLVSNNKELHKRNTIAWIHKDN